MLNTMSTSGETPVDIAAEVAVGVGIFESGKGKEMTMRIGNMLK